MTERWTDERLDRFADSVDRAIARNDEAMAQSNDRMNRIEEVCSQAASERQEFREVFQATMQVVAEMSQRHDEQIQKITEMQAQVTGMQVENRRILDHLFGNQS